MMNEDTKMLLKGAGIAMLVAAVVVWASNNVDPVENVIG